MKQFKPNIQFNSNELSTLISYIGTVKKTPSERVKFGNLIKSGIYKLGQGGKYFVKPDGTVTSYRELYIKPLSKKLFLPHSLDKSEKPYYDGFGVADFETVIIDSEHHVVSAAFKDSRTNHIEYMELPHYPEKEVFET